MFDLVADVERYPEFLKEYRAVRIRSHDGDTLHVDQVIGFASIELTLNAVAKLQQPASIIVRSEHLLLAVWRCAGISRHPEREAGWISIWRFRRPPLCAGSPSIC